MRVNNDILGKLGTVGVALLLSASALGGCKPAESDDDGETSTETTNGDGDGDGDGDGAPGDGDGMPGDGDGMPGDGDGMPGDGDGAPVDCPTHEPGEGAADGEACSGNADCASKLCEVFQDVPAGNGTCQPAPTECRTRIMGRTLDFTTREAVADVELRVAAAIQASVDPVNAAALASGTSDAMGMIDALSDGQLNAPLGIVGLSAGEGYYLTATGLASPASGSNYGPANSIHDIWVVPADALSEWSGFLMGDPALTNYLPLGDMGGVMGLVRDATTGDPISGAVVVPVSDTSSAEIRYLNEAGDGIATDMTGSSGIFMILHPGLAEEFDVEIGGVPTGSPGKAGSANNAIFTLIMNVQP